MNLLKFRKCNSIITLDESSVDFTEEEFNWEHKNINGFYQFGKTDVAFVFVKGGLIYFQLSNQKPIKLDAINNRFSLVKNTDDFWILTIKTGKRIITFEYEA